ncbi:calcium lipid binding protein, partial [Reticulomyxa filosa]
IICVNDRIGKSDPYVKLSLGKSKEKTKVQLKTLNPVWNETFKFEVKDPVRDSLVIKVRDYDMGTRDDRIGNDLSFLITFLIAQGGKLVNYELSLSETKPGTKIDTKFETKPNSKLFINLIYTEYCCAREREKEEICENTERSNKKKNNNNKIWGGKKKLLIDDNLLLVLFSFVLYFAFFFFFCIVKVLSPFTCRIYLQICSDFQYTNVFLLRVCKSLFFFVLKPYYQKVLEQLN